MQKDESTPGHTFTVRIRGTTEKQAAAYARNHSFPIYPSASFRESDPHPSAIEYFLGAIGGDLITGFSAIAARHGIQPDSVEVAVSGQLSNPLVMLGVVGESGSPGFETIRATLYVSSDAEDSVLQQIWQETLDRSPLVHSLNDRLTLSLQLHPIP
jgi:hypothetical protein